MTMSAKTKTPQTPELDVQEWASFFEGINRRLEEGEDVEATIDIVADPTEGTEADRLPLNSITYEDPDDEIAIGLGGRGRRYPAVLWHFVDKPRRVWVTENGDLPDAIIIESEDETLTLVDIHQPKG